MQPIASHENKKIIWEQCRRQKGCKLGQYYVNPPPDTYTIRRKPLPYYEQSKLDRIRNSKKIRMENVIKAYSEYKKNLNKK